MIPVIAVIGASYLQLPLVKKAKELGLHVLCFAWAQGAVCKDYADEFFPISIVEKEEILSICQDKNIDGICTIASDVAAPTVAYVAEKMGLIGNSYIAAKNANNKFLMREAFQKNQVPCPFYQKVNSFEELDLGKLAFPLIVKPTDRSGSLGVSKVNSIEQLKMAVNAALEVSFAKEVMVEEFIDGREISVEFISFKGKHYPLTITDKVTTEAPHFVELEHHQPAEFSQEEFSSIYKITENALNALNITNGASHSEYKIKSDGTIKIMELGARMGGDFIGSDLVQLSTGYDFVKGVIDVALGKFATPVIDKHLHSGVYFLSESTKYLKPIFDNIEKYPEIVTSEITDTQLHELTCSADRSGYFIYQSDVKFYPSQI